MEEIEMLRIKHVWPKLDIKPGPEKILNGLLINCSSSIPVELDVYDKLVYHCPIEFCKFHAKDIENIFFNIDLLINHIKTTHKNEFFKNVFNCTKTSHGLKNLKETKEYKIITNHLRPKKNRKRGRPITSTKSNNTQIKKIILPKPKSKTDTIIEKNSKCVQLDNSFSLEELFEASTQTMAAKRDSKETNTISAKINSQMTQTQIIKDRHSNSIEMQTDPQLYRDVFMNFLDTQVETSTNSVQTEVQENCVEKYVQTTTMSQNNNVNDLLSINENCEANDPFQYTSSLSFINHNVQDIALSPIQNFNSFL